MTEEKSLSVIMPALNEEDNLEAAVRTTIAIVPDYFSDYEILIFNDGSTDRTGVIADRLASENPHIRAFHHPSPKNLGGVYKAGIAAARKNFLVMIPGDNENGDETLGQIFELAGKADMIIPYVTNVEIRPWLRRNLSGGFVKLTNLISGCHLKYFNGTVLHKTKVIRSITINTDGFGYSAEALVKLIRRKHSYLEVGISLATRPEGGSKALKFDNVTAVLKFLSSLAFDIRRVEVNDPEKATA